MKSISSYKYLQSETSFIKPNQKSELEQLISNRDNRFMMLGYIIHSK